MRIWLVLIAVLASTAWAAPRDTVVLSGPAPLTKWLSKELSKRYSTRLAPRPVPPLPTAKEVRDVTAPVGAVALVLCQVTGPSITLQVLDGADGSPLDTVTLKASVKKLPKVMPKPQLAALLFALGSGKAPGGPAATPEPVAETKPGRAKVEPEKKVAARNAREEPKPKEPPREPIAEVKETPPPEFKSSRTYPALRASVGVGGFNRSFSYAGSPSRELATANQPFSGDIAVDASWFPGAHFTQTFAAHLGLFISGSFGVGMVSRVRADPSAVEESRFAHSANRLRFGALGRVPFGERFNLLVHAGYSRQELTTSQLAVNDGSTRPNIPDVLFNGFRGGLGLRVRLAGSVEVDALGGFQLVVGKGELGGARYFPQATAFAIDAGGGVSVELVEHVRLRAGAEWQRYFVTLNAAETSTYFARSAADQYITATASLQWSM